jgi:hypothetical protein
MDAQLLGDDINTEGGNHVEGRVGDIYDAGHTEDKGKTNGEKGEYTPTNETAYNDVYNKCHMTPRF